MFRYIAIAFVVGITSYAYAQEEKTNNEIECLAMNIYHEARSESLAVQYAVADVVLNRVESRLYPNSICGVVFQAVTWEEVPVRNKCQFSWYCDGKSDRIHDMETFDRIWQLTTGVVDGSYTIADITEGATHYHADYVEPAWAKTKTKTIEIEDHIFYRWEIQE